MLQSVNDLYELLTFNEVMQDISVKDTEILDNMKAAKEALVADRTQARGGAHSAAEQKG